MDALWVMLKNVLLFVAYAVPGIILVKSKLLKINESLVLSKVLTYVGMPFLILSSTISIDLTNSFAKTAITAVVFCVIITFAFFFLTVLLTAKEKEEKKRGVMRFAMTFSNNGFLGIPLAYWGMFFYLTVLFLSFVDKLKNIKFLKFLEVFKTPKASTPEGLSVTAFDPPA